MNDRPKAPPRPSKKDQILSLFTSGIREVPDIALITNSRPSYVASVLTGAHLPIDYHDLYTTTSHPMNVYSKFFAGQLGFRDEEAARASVALIDHYYRQFALAEDRAGQHHALLMALTMFDRARWTNKPAEAEIFRRWLVDHLSSDPLPPGRTPESPMTLFRLAPLLLAALFAVPARAAEAPTWKAGTARVKITPDKPMWMSGYASRTKPAKGTLIDLWAKALVLEDPDGRRVALVTMDLVGIPRDLSAAVCAEITKKYKLPRECICLAVSHTHTGPVVGRNLSAMYFLDAEQQRLVDDYAAALRAKLVDVVGAAIGNLGPADLSHGNGHVTFAVNRRNNKEADVPALRELGRLKGPVDHDVPVLCVRDKQGRVKAVLFGYACHATVLSSYQWSGDYPGFAQIALEKAHPGAVALFWAGCGADQNPLPRRSVELAEKYGQELAGGVEAVLAAPMTPVAGKLAAAYAEVDLPFADLPTRDKLVEDSTNKDKYVAARAKQLLRQIKDKGSLAGTYPYPVQAWQLGRELTFVALGGEVVVDYSLRLKNELGRDATWVAGYSNDVMAYIPSLRVLKEGGYEGGGAMVYYGLPTVWGAKAEDVIVAAVHEQVKKVRGGK